MSAAYRVAERGCEEPARRAEKGKRRDLRVWLDGQAYRERQMPQLHGVYGPRRQVPVKMFLPPFVFFGAVLSTHPMAAHEAIAPSRDLLKLAREE